MELGMSQIDIERPTRKCVSPLNCPVWMRRTSVLEIANGVLFITGEKNRSRRIKERRFSERYYGRFERRIPAGGRR